MGGLYAECVHHFQQFAVGFGHHIALLCLDYRMDGIDHQLLEEGEGGDAGKGVDGKTADVPIAVLLFGMDGGKRIDAEKFLDGEGLMTIPLEDADAADGASIQITNQKGNGSVGIK